MYVRNEALVEKALQGIKGGPPSPDGLPMIYVKGLAMAAIRFQPEDSWDEYRYLGWL